MFAARVGKREEGDAKEAMVAEKFSPVERRARRRDQLGGESWRAAREGNNLRSCSREELNFAHSK